MGSRGSPGTVAFTHTDTHTHVLLRTFTDIMRSLAPYPNPNPHNLMHNPK